jgi:hypothetical protein
MKVLPASSTVIRTFYGMNSMPGRIETPRTFLGPYTTIIILASSRILYRQDSRVLSHSNSLPTICQAILVMIGRTMSLSVNNKAQIDDHLVQEYCQRYPKKI